MSKYPFVDIEDLTLVQHVQPVPVMNAAGACIANDIRGSDKYLYALLGTASFWRYDVIEDGWQQLANPPALTFAAGCDLCMDPSLNRVWLFAPGATTPYAIFAYYDIPTNIWTTRTAPSGLPAQWGTDAALMHVCSSYNPCGDDDKIYLIGNNSTVMYQYSNSNDSWIALGTAVPAAVGAGCALIWTYHNDADKFLLQLGGATAGFYTYSLGTPGFTVLTPVPNSETYSTGSNASYIPDLDIVAITKDATHRVYGLNLLSNKLTPIGAWLYLAGTARAGDGQIYIKNQDNYWLYYRLLSGQDFWRMWIS